MRIPYHPTLLAALAAGLTASQAGLKVHEWGTFTVLKAPDGSTLTWYLGADDVAPLPEFVSGAARRNTFAVQKASQVTPYAIRMETPVLYFYPDGPMDVKVAVNFPEGVITETFPHAVKSRTGASWQGSLVPVSPDSLKTVPDASGPAGRHYAAARAVPDAWLFRQPVPPPSKEQLEESGAAKDAPPPPPQTDHFIFYRGAGNNLARNIFVSTGDDHTFRLINQTEDIVPVVFALRVAGGKSAWKRVDNLLPYKFTYDQTTQKGIETGPQDVALPDATEPFAVSTPGLKAEMLAVLEKEGLTKPEAAAMVATWDNLWFEEPGIRMLAVLPRPWVDEVLPLTVTPAPEDVARVFVSRIEMVSVAQQNALVTLLSQSPADPAAARAQLRKLDLGRFAPGAVDRAVTVKEREMRSIFAGLNAPEPAPEPVIGKVR